VNRSALTFGRIGGTSNERVMVLVAIIASSQ
jgi:hypothetical protein